MRAGGGARWYCRLCMASLTAGGRALAAARGHDGRTWTQRAGPGFLSRFTPRHIRPHYLRFNTSRCRLDKVGTGWGGGRGLGGSECLWSRPLSARTPGTAPGGAGPVERMDEAGPPTRRPAVKGGGALGPLRALLTGRVSEVRGGRYLPSTSEERGGHRGAVRGGGGLCAHSGRGVPSDRIAVFPLVWAVSFISSRAFQGRGPRKREGQTDGQRTNLMRSDERRGQPAGRCQCRGGSGVPADRQRGAAPRPKGGSGTSCAPRPPARPPTPLWLCS